MIQLNDPGPREGKAKRITLQFIAVIIIVWVTLFTWKQWNAPYVEQPATCDLCYGQDSVERVARDTILIPMKEGGYSSLREALDAGTQMTLKLDTEYVDTAGHTWRLHAGSTVATLPKGFPFWVIWDTPGYRVSKWGKRRAKP